MASIIGRNIYSQFDTVVMLDEQMCIFNQPWMEILKRSWTGSFTRKDLTEIRKLILTNSKCNIPDFDKELWNDDGFFSLYMIVYILELSILDNALPKDWTDSIHL